MARERKKKYRKSRTQGSAGRQGYDDHDLGPSQHLIVQNRNRVVDRKRDDTWHKLGFSLQDEARNTERDHIWGSGRKLRHSQVTFVNAEGYEPKISMIRQEIPSKMTHSADSQAVSPQVALASMTINDQGITHSGGHPLVEVPSRDALVGSTVQRRPVSADRCRPIDDRFIMDAVGAPAPLRQNLPAPKTLHPEMSTRSDSSEEVIVFKGRRRTPLSSFQNRDIAAREQTSRSERCLPANHEMVGSLAFATTSSANSEIAQLHNAKGSVSPMRHTSPLISSRPQPNIPATEGSVNQGGLSHKRRQGKRRPMKDIPFLKEEAEEQILADYIEHIDNEEDLGEESNNISRSRASLEADLTALGSRDLKDQKFREIPPTIMVAGSVPSDSEFARGAINDNPNHGTSTDGRFNQSITDMHVALEFQESTGDFEDNWDLMARKQAGMTDEHIARLLSKQEAMGLGSSELLLFDGDDVENEDQSSEEVDDATAISSFIPAQLVSHENEKRGFDSNSSLSSSSFAAKDAFHQGLQGDFDVMDRHAQSLKKATKAGYGGPGFNLSDTELEATLQLAWEKDRSKKKLRKKEREQLRVQGLLPGKNQVDLKIKYRKGISFGEIKDEITGFMISANQSLALPPMVNKDRRVIHELAHILGLKSKSRGTGKARFPVVYKTRRTGDFDAATVGKVESLIHSQRFFTSHGIRGPMNATGLRHGRRNAVNSTGVSYRDGEVVGAAAPELGEENRGRTMLEKMGWSKGTALGALNNKGMLLPVVHTVKTTKAGLG
ncbi:MAG: hypothetical protein Q9219_007097 [cf. Caloplaca sp. 3 TL-2023]